MRQVLSIDCNSRINSIKFSSNGKLLAVLTWKHEIQVWHTDSYVQVGSLALDGWVSGFSLSPSGETVAVIRRLKDQPTANLILLHTESMSVKGCFDVGDAFAVALCDKNTPIAIGRPFRGMDKPSAIEIYDEHFNACIDRLELLHHDFAHSLEFCSTTSLLGSTGVGASVWDLTTKTLVWDLVSADAQGVLKRENIDAWESTVIDVSRNGEYVAVGHWGTDGGETEKVCLYSVKAREVIGWYCCGYEMIDSVALSPNGRFVAATGHNDPRMKEFDQTARVWSVESGELVSECKLEGMSTAIFSPDGRFLVTGADSPNSLVIWELPIADTAT